MKNGRVPLFDIPLQIRHIPDARRKIMIEIIGNTPTDAMLKLMWLINYHSQADIILRTMLTKGIKGQKFYEYFIGDLHCNYSKFIDHILGSRKIMV